MSQIEKAPHVDPNHKKPNKLSEQLFEARIRDIFTPEGIAERKADDRAELHDPYERADRIAAYDAERAKKWTADSDSFEELAEQEKWEHFAKFGTAATHITVEAPKSTAKKVKVVSMPSTPGIEPGVAMSEAASAAAKSTRQINRLDRVS